MYNIFTIGVAYAGSHGNILNEDLATMPKGAAFFYISCAKAGGARSAAPRA